MEDKKENSFISNLFALVKVVIVILLIQMYIEAWIKSYKEKQWLKFCLLSLLPMCMIGCLINEIIERSEPNVHRDMFDAQMSAWQRDNGL